MQTNLVELSSREFVSAISTKAPVPGGGGACALVASIGMALGNMVGSLTLGKPKYKDVQEDILVLTQKATALQNRFLELVDLDAQAFEPLSRAYSLPKETPEQQEIKKNTLEEALVQASVVPLSLMKDCAQAIQILEEFSLKGSLIAISDAGCGAICCKAALQGAYLNVKINTKAMKNREVAGKIDDEAQNLLQEYESRAQIVYERVAACLR
jgi:formiminotetrahydrofolate cyclodeaminase